MHPARYALLLATLAAPLAAQPVWLGPLGGSGPSARTGHALAYDSVRGRTVLFGGIGLGGRLSDTWEWDGQAWVERFPANRPASRERHGLAFDSARGRTVLFGGLSSIGGSLDDTWEWDGTDWHQRSPLSPPGGRYDHTLAYDPGRRRVVVYGGTPSILSDTWEWDGTSWTSLPSGIGPGPRRDHAMAYDAGRRSVVLFGGLGLPGIMSDAWEWDGSLWAIRPIGTAPPPRANHGLTYDGARRRIVVFSGSTGQPPGPPSDTWELDGTGFVWTQRVPGTSPPARAGHALAYDSRRGRVVLFGGNDPAAQLLSDTWEYCSPCDVVGPGQPGGGLPIACLGAPRAGATFCLGFGNPGPLPAGFNLLLIAPGPPAIPPILLQPPVVCLPALLHLLPESALEARGNPVVFCALLPSDPALAGAGFTVQGASLEIGVCFRATDALVFVIQP